MKILIAIASCARDTKNGFNEAIRKTWLKESPVDYKFILGKSAASSSSDELVVDCNDDYNHLPYKTLELLRWAVANDYDYVFKCDTDTYVVLSNLLASSYGLYDYVGTFNGSIGIPDIIYGKCFSWASGGSGYWLSNRAMKFILEKGVGENAICPALKIPCEDLWIGQVLGQKIKDGIFTAFDEPGYNKNFNENYKTIISSHYCSEGMKRKFDTAWMYKHHEINTKN